MEQNQPFVIDLQEIKLATDVIAIAYYESNLYLLLVERKYAPHAGQWALPGGFFKSDEELDVAALRELSEETAVQGSAYLEQIGAFGKVGRDPRRRIISIAYLALLSELPPVKADTDASDAKWWNLAELPAPLAFDHDHIVEKTLSVLKNKLRYTTEGKHLLPKHFKEEDLKNLYQLVLKQDFREDAFANYLTNSWALQKTADGMLEFK